MRQRTYVLFLVSVSSVLWLCGPRAEAENWPSWRGPRQDGTSLEQGLPIRWDWTTPEDAAPQSENIVWRCELPVWGTSTPVIWEDSIFLTAHEDDARLLVLKIDRPTGDIVWTREVGSGSAARTTPRPRGDQKFHREHNFATPSVATDGELIVAHFGNGDTAVLDFDGRLLWRRNMQEEHGKYTIWWGHGNSPVLWRDLVILVCMQDSCADLWETPSPSYIVAYDKRTGELRWKTMRMTGAEAEHCDSYTTPLIWEHKGRNELVIMGGEVLDAYDPASGERLWWLQGLEGNRLITGPTPHDDTLYLTRGMRGPTIAVRPSGLGAQSPDVVLWSNERGTPDSPTPVVADGLVYTVSDRGVAKCIDAETGQTVWEERLRGNFRASPLWAEGRVYILNMRGEATVVRAGRKYELLATNTIDDTTIASPIAAGGHLYIRGNNALYCIGEQD